jgi:hypothetical protein
VNLLNPSVKNKLSIPEDVVSSDFVLGSVFWINDEELGAIIMNRRQNKGVFVAYNAVTFQQKEASLIIHTNDLSK